MKTDSHTKAFTRTLAGTLHDLKMAVERSDKSEAYVQYAMACGLIGGAALSGGISKQAGQQLLVTLAATRSVLMDAFGDAPAVSVPLIN